MDREREERDVSIVSAVLISWWQSWHSIGNKRPALCLAFYHSLFPSIYCIYTIHLSPCQTWVGLAKGREGGMAWKRRDGVLLGSFQTEHSASTITLLNVSLPVRSFLGHLLSKTRVSLYAINLTRWQAFRLVFHQRQTLLTNHCSLKGQFMYHL